MFQHLSNLRLIPYIIKELTIMSEALDNLTAKIQAQSTVIQGAETLLSTLASEIRNNVDDSDALNALADTIDNQTSALSAAVLANTPGVAQDPAPSSINVTTPAANPTGDTVSDASAAIQPGS